MIKAAVENFGRIDCVVNNAGILRDRIFHRMSEVDWDTVIKVHLYGAFYMSKARRALLQGAGVGLVRALHLDLGPGRQLRPGQLRGGQDGHRRAVASRSRSTWRASTCAPTASRRSPGRA